MAGQATVLERLNRTWKESDRIYHEVARRSGLSDCAFWVMYGLMGADRALPQKELSQTWMYSRQTVASALQQLRKLDLVAVRLAEGSRRDKVIKLTPAGRDFVTTHVAPVAAAETQALNDMGPDSERFVELMSRYVTALDHAVTGR